MVEPRRSRWSGPGLVRLYPSAWRVRYEPEMLALLGERSITTREALDLVRGAADARLHPEHPSTVPSGAAILAGAAWMVVALGALAEPVMPDWPGFLAWTLPPAVVGAAAGIVAALGVSLRLGDAPGRAARLLVVTLVLTGAAWTMALLAAAAGGFYGAGTSALGDLVAVATFGLGVVLGHRGRSVPGLALVAVGGALLLPAPGAWIVAALAWSGLGLWLRRDRAVTGLRHAGRGSR
jgi:hypothetical protein